MLTPDQTPGAAENPVKIFRVGTLEYTMRGIIVLFFWLLWGDFAASFFGSVFGPFLTLYLKDLQASNVLIGVMMGSIGGVINILFLPGISRNAAADGDGAFRSWRSAPPSRFFP